MSNLLEQYQGHQLYQTLSNKLEEINNAINNETYNEKQKESLLAYQQIFILMQTNLNTRTLPIVPNRILNDLNAAIQNLHISYILDMDNYYTYYQQLMNSYKMLFTIEKKSEVKESLNQILENFSSNQNRISTLIDSEINNFKSEQTEQISSWKQEKEQMQSEIEQLKQEKTQLEKEVNSLSEKVKNQENKMNEQISNFKNDYETNRDDFEKRFTNKEKEYNTKIENLLNEQKNAAKVIISHLEQRQDEVEKLWGIIGQAAISGNSQNYANKAKETADRMMWATLIIMGIVVSVLSITTVIDLISGTFNYIHFIYKIIGSTIFLVPALYCSNISKRHRDREFQLRDFEVKTAALEPFMENMILDNSDDKNSTINKDNVKLELTKVFFDKQFASNNSQNDCILIPKEIAKILNSLAKKCNLNVNLGDKNE